MKIIPDPKTKKKKIPPPKKKKKIYEIQDFKSYHVLYRGKKNPNQNTHSL